MAHRERIGVDVFTAAVERVVSIMEQGHRVVCSFSGGKDSTCTLGVCLIAAKVTGYGPVDVVMRDEEIMLPGTFEYAERVRLRPDVRFHWFVAHQPIVNAFNRADPYWWVFDPLLDPSKYVRPMPEWATKLNFNGIYWLASVHNFPPPEGKDLYVAMGLRCAESRGRLYGLFSQRGAFGSKTPKAGYRKLWAIYDWEDGDVWKAIKDNGWDYNSAYDVMARFGIPRSRMRISPPTITPAAATEMQIASRAWPKWFERVCDRCPGTRAVAHFGRRAVEPYRRQGETWKDCFIRECIDQAPAWIAERATKAMNSFLDSHARHATTPFPEVAICLQCDPMVSSWKKLAFALRNGDPFTSKTSGVLDNVQPEFFRPGSGSWDAPPTW